MVKIKSRPTFVLLPEACHNREEKTVVTSFDVDFKYVFQF